MKYQLLFICLLSITSLLSQVPENAYDIAPLLISEPVPDIEIIDLNGNPMHTSELLKGKKSVLIFYRGGWCPYCNTHLSEVGLVESDIKALGYQVVAFSPDSPSKLKETEAKGNFQYTLYSDARGELMKAMGIAFKAPKRYEEMLSMVSDEKNEGLLPVPSVFVVNEDEEIIFEYISPNYRGRIGADLLLDVLRRLNEETE